MERAQRQEHLRSIVTQSYSFSRERDRGRGGLSVVVTQRSRRVSVGGCWRGYNSRCSF